MVSLPPLKYAYDAHSRNADANPGVGNPPFHPWRYSTNPSYGALQQGYMVQHQHAGAATFGSTSGAWSTDGLPWKFRFMYNPSEIVIDYGSPTATQWPNGYLGSGDQGSMVIGATGASLQFTLYIDRMYEVNLPLSSPKNPQPYSHATGVLVDIDAFEKLNGIIGIGKNAIQAVPLDIYFGSEHSLHWLGYITSAVVTMAQFSVDMVPFNMMLQVSVAQMYPGDPPTATLSKDAATNIANTAAQDFFTAINASGKIFGGGAPQQGPRKVQYGPIIKPKAPIVGRQPAPQRTSRSGILVLPRSGDITKPTWIP